jgi:hypothetical protein
MVEMVSPSNEAEIIVNKLASNAPDRLNMHEALDLLSSEEYDPNNHHLKGARQLAGIFFEEVIGARLAKSFDGFSTGPNYNGNREIDYVGEYPWDFKGTTYRKCDNSNNAAYSVDLNTQSTIKETLNKWDGLGFVVMHYKIIERESADQPALTNRVRTLRNRACAEKETINKTMRAATIIEPKVIDAYWIDGAEDYHNLVDNSLWSTRPITPPDSDSGRPVMRFHTSRKSDMLVAEAEV